MELFWTFFILSVSFVFLFFLHSRRSYSWGWNVLVAVILIYGGLYQLTGSPRNPCMLATLQNLSGSLEVVHLSLEPNMAIYLLVRSHQDERPIYLALPWDTEMADNAAQAYMSAQDRHTVLMVRADDLSRCTVPPQNEPQRLPLSTNSQSGGQAGSSEDGARMFYPRPVGPDPLKDTHRMIIIQEAPPNQ